MSGWGLVALTGTDWLPSRLLASETPWPPSVKVIRLGDVAAVRSLTAPLRAPLPLVTPSNVERESGAITPVRVADDEGLVLGDELRLNDVLVPAHGSGPCVRVSDDARGLAFRGFLRVRPLEDRVAADWLWGFLSSTSGIRARANVAAGTALSRLTAAALADVRLPLPSIEQASRRPFARLLPRQLVFDPAGEALRSSWSLHDLRDGAAWVGGEASEAEPIGTELSELGELWSGSVDMREAFASPGPGRMRVLTPRAVRGHSDPFEPWATGRRLTTAESVVFTRTEPFRVMHAPPGLLLARDLVALDLRVGGEKLIPPRVGTVEGLVSFFARSEGRGVLLSLSAGTVLRHLSLAALRKVRVPEKALVSHHDSPGSPSLAERLEVALREALL